MGSISSFLLFCYMRDWIRRSIRKKAFCIFWKESHKFTTIPFSLTQWQTRNSSETFEEYPFESFRISAHSQYVSEFIKLTFTFTGSPKNFYFQYWPEDFFVVSVSKEHRKNWRPGHHKNDQIRVAISGTASLVKNRWHLLNVGGYISQFWMLFCLSYNTRFFLFCGWWAFQKLLLLLCFCFYDAPKENVAFSEKVRRLHLLLSRTEKWYTSKMVSKLHMNLSKRLCWFICVES